MRSHRRVTPDCIVSRKRKSTKHPEPGLMPDSSAAGNKAFRRPRYAGEGCKRERTRFRVSSARGTGAGPCSTTESAREDAVLLYAQGREGRQSRALREGWRKTAVPCAMRKAVLSKMAEARGTADRALRLAWGLDILTKCARGTAWPCSTRCHDRTTARKDCVLLYGLDREERRGRALRDGWRGLTVTMERRRGQGG